MLEGRGAVTAPIDIQGHDRARDAKLAIRSCPLFPGPRGAAPKPQGIELPALGDLQQVIKQCPCGFVFVRSAPPRALAELRDTLSEKVRASVVGELGKDLTHLPIADITRYLAA